ncbi:MAG: hypothetical protein ACRDTF_04820 [Pseudonocardiaceae bacterium]
MDRFRRIAGLCLDRSRRSSSLWLAGRSAGLGVPAAVLTAAHVIDGAVAVRVRFDRDLPGEWTTEVSRARSRP